MTFLVRARCAHPIKISARWRTFSHRRIIMIIEASKLQFGSIINLLLRFILHLSALQLMLWLQSYNGLKFYATVRVRSEVRWQNSGVRFGGRIRDHVTFIYLLSRRAPKTFVSFPDAHLKFFSIIYLSIINQPSVDACRSVTR